MQNTNIADKNAEQTEQQAVSHPPTHFVDDGRLPYDHLEEKQPSQPIAGFGWTNISEPAITATNSMIDFMKLHRQIIKDTRVFPEPRERRGYTGRILREIHGSRLHHDILFPAPVLANSDLPATTSASSSILTPRTDLYSGPGYAGSRVTTVVTTRQISHDEAAEEQTLLVPPQPTIPTSAATSFSSSASSSENPWLSLDASSSASSSENPWLLLDDTIDDAGAELTTNRRVQSAATAEPADPTMQKRQLATVTCCILL